MTTPPPTPPPSPTPNAPFDQEAMAQIDAYLAGELDAAAARGVEARAASDRVFGAELEAQRLVNRDILRAFQPPAISAPAARPLSAPRSFRWMGLAAAVAVVGLGAAAYLFWPTGGSDGVQTPDRIYRTIVKQGFKPAIVCPNDPAEFARLVKGKLGVALTPTLAQGSGVALTGWGYANNWGTPLGPGVMILLATKGDAKIVVFIDRAGNDRTLPEPGSGRRLFKKDAGGLVLYEISPLDQPIILPALEAR